MTHCYTLLTLFTAVFVIALCDSATHLALSLKEKLGRHLIQRAVFHTRCKCVYVRVSMHMSYPAVVCYRADVSN